jgi:hypothetical protein
VIVREAVHSDPVWRERSDFVVAIEIDSADTNVHTEQLWVRKIDDRHFEICCIPFFVYDLALGDTVEVDQSYLVQGVTQSSGRFVFRVYFDNSNRQERFLTTESLVKMGALMEWSSSSMLAVDARDVGHAQDVAAYLAQREALGRLIYETGKS